MKAQVLLWTKRMMHNATTKISSSSAEK
jgi:hypothetical protein